MTSGILRPVSDDVNLEKHLERQMGCMAGFFQIFDRHHGIYGPKRIPSATGSTSPSERSDLSAQEASDMFPSSPENLLETPSPASKPASIPLPAFDFKEGMKNSWKLREAPRLSLDSRLRPREIRTTTASYSPNQSDIDSDKNRRSPSVVARLMGLDALPDAGDEPLKQAELRRSASESRVSRDLPRFVEGSFYQKPQPPLSDNEIYKFRSESKQTPPPTTKQSQIISRRSYFNAQEFFPEPNRTGSRSLYSEIEKRLRMRGIDEPEKDLEALRQILEALQLKGLLHSSSKTSNLISDRPIVVMEPVRRPGRRSDSEPHRSVPARRNSPVEEKRVRSRSPRSQDPSPRRKPVYYNNGRNSPVQCSPRSSPRRAASDLVTACSPGNHRQVKEGVRLQAEDGAATTISESSACSSSLFDLQRSKMEYRAGQSLLERCDKLLDSIAAFTSAEQLIAGDPQPSPVSVLDSSFLGEESSPSPVKKRSIDFKDPLVDWEDERWVPTSPITGSRPDYVPESEYSDFAYVSNLIFASERHQDSPLSDVYNFLEKRHGATDASGGSVHRRRLIFDAVEEILHRKRYVSSWESFSRRGRVSCGPRLIKDVWCELAAVNAEVATEDLNAVVCGAIRKDVEHGDHGWGDTSVEMSDAVLHIERMVFKDLVVELIGDLAGLAGTRTRDPLPRRKLLF